MIRIAAVSSEVAIDQIIRNGERFKDIKITPYIYENPIESKQVVEQIVDCDVVLFAGPLPYLVSKEVVEEKKWPAVFIPLDEYTLTSTIFYTMIHHPKEISRISIDVENALSVEQVANEFNLSKENWHILDSGKMLRESPETFNINKVLDFHINLWEAGETDFIITSVDNVYSVLKEKGIAAKAMHVPEKAVTDTINKAITYSQLAISKNAEISIGIVVFSQMKNIIHDFGNIDQDTTVFLHQIMLEFGKQQECSVRLIGLDQFIIYGTRGSVERLIAKENLLLFFHQLERVPEVAISMGFGYGYTAGMAEKNARIALYHARSNTDQGHSIYIVSEEQEVMNPLEDQNKTFSLKSEDNHLLAIGNKTGLSISTISKLLRFESLRRNSSFTSIDLEDYLQISRRSAERILKKLLESHYVDKVGEEQPHAKGRPRAVYRINFD